MLIGVLNHGSSVVFLSIVVALLIRRSMARGRITAERIVAAICAYLLLGLIWSEAYQVLAAIYYPTPILSGAGESGHFAYNEYLYFSFVTLTTLGYGDILPVHASSRVLAYLEAVTGVLYLATLVARLVAQHIAHEGLDRYMDALDDAVDDAVDDALAERDDQSKDDS